MLVQSGPIYFCGKQRSSGAEQSIRRVGEAFVSLQEAQTPEQAGRAGRKLAKNWVGTGLRLLGKGLWEMASGFFKR